MILIRMAAAPALYALFCLILLTRAVCASPWLPDDVSDFIPSCAERCVASFLDVNYEVTRCISRPSLRCFCTTEGNTDFTLGEGAVQCITTEKRFGSCSDDDASQLVIDSAYFMCHNQPGAVEPSHAVITASLLLPLSSGGFVSFPPIPTATRDPINLPTSLPETLVTGSEELPNPVPSTAEHTDTNHVPTTFGTITQTSQTSQTSQVSTSEVPTETGTGAPPPPAETESNDEDSDDSSTALSTGQVAGISVGVVAAAGVAVGAILLSRYCRRRKNPNVRTAFLPSRSTWGYNLGSGSSTTISNNSIMAARTVDIPDPSTIPPLPTYSRTSYHRASWRPEAIGLALTPAHQKKDSPQTPQTRRMSRLLPAKPIMPPLMTRRSSRPPQTPNLDPTPPELRRWGDSPPRLPPLTGLSGTDIGSHGKPHPPVPLKLDIPRDNGKSVVPRTDVPRARESTMTEFEEDEGPSSMSSEGQIWRPPSMAPSSAAPYYVADKNGNWVLANAAKSGAVKLPAVSLSSEPRSAPASGPKNPIIFPTISRSLSGSHGPKSQQGPPSRPSLAPPASITRSQAAASSVYSQHSSIPYPLFYSGRNDQSQSEPPSRPTPNWQLNRNSSRSSDVTLFDSSSDESKEPTPPEMAGSLSPVVESPRSGSGRSPVVYPRIASRLRNSTTNRPNQPPPTRLPAYYPPGQPSPTLGTMQHQNPPPQGMSSYNVPTKGRRPMENPGLVRSGSPPTMRIVEPSPEPDDRGQLPSARAHSRPPSFQPSYSSQIYPSPHQRPPQFQQQRQAPWPLQQRQPQPPRQSFNRYPYSTAGPVPLYREPQPLPPLHPSNRPKPQRFGPHHPHEAPLPSYQQPPPQPHLDTAPVPPAAPGSSSYQSPVSEVSTSSSLLAKRVGSDRAAQMALAEESISAHPQWRREGPHMTPQLPHEGPSTSGWMPKLTPTRRGEDLFLNVH